MPDYDPYSPRSDGVVRFPGQRIPPKRALKKAAKKLTGGDGRDEGGKDLGDRDTPEMWSDDETGAAASKTVAAGQLRSLIERIERMEEEKKSVAEDIKDIYAEAKGNGFDTKAIRTIVRLRKKDPAEREEEETILDLYKAALGMV